MAHLSRTLDPAPVAASLVARRTPPPRLARFALIASVALSITLAHLLGHGEMADRAAAADPELARLLRGMAALKAGIALAAVGLVAWRLAYPSSLRFAGGLVSAAALMAAGPVLMWHVAPVGAAALLFHAGMALLLVLCWADRSDAREVRAAVTTQRRTARP